MQTKVPGYAPGPTLAERIEPMVPLGSSLACLTTLKRTHLQGAYGRQRIWLVLLLLARYPIRLFPIGSLVVELYQPAADAEER